MVYFTALVLLSGCITAIDKAPASEASSATPTMSPIPASSTRQEMITSTVITSGIENIVFPTATPSPKANATVTVESNNNFLTWGTVDYEQKTPISFSVPTVTEKQYIYKNALASFNFGVIPSGSFYLNLDDLTDNWLTNSDVEILASTGSMGTTYILRPLNHAQYYYFDKRNLNYSDCESAFPLIGFDEISYDGQSFWVNRGGSYCILTNMGHLAIVYPVKDSLSLQPFTLVISVYSQLMDDGYTPIATETPGPTQIANNYPGFTSAQAQTFERAILEFIENLKNDDKAAILEQLNFPLWITIHQDEVHEIKSKSEFLYIYKYLFTDVFKDEITSSSLKDVSIDSLSISLSLKDGYILFDSRGKIYSIKNLEVLPVK